MSAAIFLHMSLSSGSPSIPFGPCAPDIPGDQSAHVYPEVHMDLFLVAQRIHRM